jgi:hypothetical protein
MHIRKDYKTKSVHIDELKAEMESVYIDEVKTESAVNNILQLKGYATLTKCRDRFAKSVLKHKLAGTTNRGRTAKRLLDNEGQNG